MFFFGRSRSAVKLADKNADQGTAANPPRLNLQSADEMGQMLTFPPMPEVVIGDTLVDCDNWCAALPREKKLLGFSAAKYRKGDLYMIQLATRDSILLVPVTPALPFPSSVRSVLQDLDSIKTGIDVAKDIDALIKAVILHADYKFKPLTKKNERSFEAIQNGFLDIGSYCQVKLNSEPPGSSDNNRFATSHTLKSLCEELKFDLASENILPTPPSPRVGNFGASGAPPSTSLPAINADQRQSAATHAWYARWLALEAIQQAKNNSVSLSPRSSGL